MTISYKWLSEYLPVTVDPERLSRILTSIGLEVESMHKFEEVKGGLQGLVIGEVLSTEKHPNADKLTLTKVNIGGTEPLQIVCGAPNVAAGQKVVHMHYLMNRVHFVERQGKLRVVRNGAARTHAGAAAVYIGQHGS